MWRPHVTRVVSTLRREQSAVLGPITILVILGVDEQ
jgi:hypothetical protein